MVVNEIKTGEEDCKKESLNSDSSPRSIIDAMFFCVPKKELSDSAISSELQNIGIEYEKQTRILEQCASGVGQNRSLDNSSEIMRVNKEFKASERDRYSDAREDRVNNTWQPSEVPSLESAETEEEKKEIKSALPHGGTWNPLTVPLQKHPVVANNLDRYTSVYEAVPVDAVQSHYVSQILRMGSSMFMPSSSGSESSDLFAPSKLDTSNKTKGKNKLTVVAAIPVDETRNVSETKLKKSEEKRTTVETSNIFTADNSQKPVQKAIAGHDLPAMDSIALDRICGERKQRANHAVLPKPDLVQLVSLPKSKPLEKPIEIEDRPKSNQKVQRLPSLDRLVLKDVVGTTDSRPASTVNGKPDMVQFGDVFCYRLSEAGNSILNSLQSCCVGPNRAGVS